MTTFKAGDHVRVLPTAGLGGHFGDEGVVKFARTDGRPYPIEVKLTAEDHTGPFRADELELIEVEPLVTFVNPNPKVRIDLKKLDGMYTTPLDLTIEQATQLLRELDAVIL